MFPLGDDNSDRTSFPIVNVVLIIANLLVFAVFQGMGNNANFTMAYSTVPAEIMTGQDIVTDSRTVQMNSVDGPQAVIIPGLQETPIPVYLTLLTAIFMHGGLAHLGGNMWFLWIFGDNIEQNMGRLRYLLFYLACGLIASMAHVLLNRTGDTSMIPSLGASGAISGVMGAYLILSPLRSVTVLLLRMVTQVPGYVAVGLWFVFQVVSSLGMLGGMDTGVAYAAHVGGFLAGVVLAKPFCIGRADDRSALTWRQHTRIQP